MAIEIPVTPAANEQKLLISLDGSQYVLRARWNSRDASWYLDAWESDGKTVIAYGVKLVMGALLGAQTGHPLFVNGVIVDDFKDTGIEAGLLDLGSRVALVHFTPLDRALSSLP